jgi:hypothetical protein
MHTRLKNTYSVVASLFALITLLVSLGLGLIRSLVLVGEFLPLLTKNLSNVTCTKLETGKKGNESKWW